ncbi:MAG: protoporphyrinogen oxidase [Sphingomonadales bacterium]|nr:protoporphyrinogen oxidase [Sphingomonadales bacterium]
MFDYDLNTALIVTYQWIKAAHVIFVIFWIAGLFMLPRYYVYHQEAPAGSAEEQRWIERERKLRNIIITPAMLIVWALGLSLAYSGGAWNQTWLQLKLLLVLGLSAYHGWMIGYGRRLARGERPVSGRSLRLMNEIPGVATALIVILVIVKPF